MSLLYRDGQWLLDGEPISDEDLAAYRDAAVDGWADELGALAIIALGLTGAPRTSDDTRFSAEAIALFALLFPRRVGDILTTAYVTARGGVAAVPAAGWRAVAGMVATQDQYAQGFVTALQAGTVSEAQAVARARSYANAATAAFEAGKTARVGFAAPAQPGDGCRGGSRCRCYWSIVEFPDRFEGTWKAVGDDSSCDVCRQRAKDWSPHVHRKTEGA